MNPVLLSGNVILSDSKEIFLLHKIKANHLEFPGGKVDKEECKDFENPTEEELKTAARRELLEETSGIESVESMEYLGNVEAKIPDGRTIISHAFLTKVKGRIKANEPETFDEAKSGFFKIKELQKYKLAPNIEPILEKLKF